MNNNEHRGLGKKKLVEMLRQQENENEKLRARVTELEQRLEDRAIAVGKVGSMAEAALALNGVIERTDQAAAQYLENIRRCSEAAEGKITEAEKKAREIIECAEREKQNKINEAEAYWNDLSARIIAFYNERTGLPENLLDLIRRPASGNK